MADVSVEFGAQDAGLQKTLQTIQQQMTSLQGEVDSGTLSFQEISQKMREIKQAESIFTKLGGEISQAAKSAKEFEDQIRRAEAVTKSNRTALEIYSDEVDQLQKLLDAGLITQKTYAAAIEKAEAALKAATPQTEEAKRANEELQAALKLAEQETRALAEEQKKAEAVTKSNRTALEVYSDEVDQLGKLLDSGLISQKTYASAIEKAEAALKAATPQTEEAKRANEALEASLKKAEAETKALAQEQARAEAITKANRTATQIYNDEVEELQKHLSAGRISTETFASAVEKADAKLAAANPQVQELGKEIKTAGDKSDKMGEQAEIGFGKLASAVAAGQLAANAAMAGIKAAINLAKAAIDDFGAALDLGGRLSDLAARTGEAEGNLLLLERAFQNSGAGAEAVGPAINKLQKFMEDAAQGGATQTQAMEDLGLSFTDLQGKTPIEQMQIFAERISAIEDPGKRAALAMDVFGRSGGELLPFLTNFSGEIDTAKGQLGGMVDIMNRNAATFDAVSDKVNIAKGKFMEFAAGILDRAIPALDAITEGLSRIDAAKIGQELADAFLGGESAMNGFQAAVDAFKTGKIREAFEILWDSIVLQSLQTANEIYKNLVAAFKTAADFIKTIFAGDGMLMTYIEGAFQLVGTKAGAAIAEALASALPDDFIFGGLKKAMSDFATSAKEDADMLFGAMYHDADLLAAELASAGAALPDTFKEKYAETQGIFGDLEERSAALKAKQDEITAAVAKTNEEKGKGAPVDQQATEEAEKQKAINAEIAAEKAKMEGLQNALNAAIASGNELEQQTIEKMIQAEESKKRIKQLTDQYIASGLGEKEAGQLAANLVNSEIAAANVKKNVEGAKTELDNAGKSVDTVKEKVERLYGTPMDKPAKGFKEELNLAREQLFKLQTFIGEDLSRMNLSSIMDKLGLDADSTGSSEVQLMAIQRLISDLGNEDPADVTPEIDVPGSRDNIAQIKKALKETEGTDATPQIDQESVKQQASAARKTVEDDLKKVEAAVTVKPKLDKEALKEEVDMAFASSKGTQHLANIDKLVDVIKGFVQKIEGKLPLQALA